RRPRTCPIATFCQRGDSLMDPQENREFLVVGRSLPPHPGPLPKGEGAVWAAPRSTVRGRVLGNWTMVLPLPWGAGWGEGGGDALCSWGSCLRSLWRTK